ncbi:TPA_asm: hypothetical protein [Altiarchaeum virus]|nr:TPA_asm: hypothetical protein [Altiarchaeum virus]
MTKKVCKNCSKFRNECYFGGIENHCQEWKEKRGTNKTYVTKKAGKNKST